MKILVLILLILGGIFSLHEYKAKENDAIIATRGIRTVARIADVKEKRVRGLAKLFSRPTIVSLDFYPNNQKNAYSVEKQFDTLPPEIQRGKDIEIIYDPQNPSLAYLPGQRVFSIGGAIFAACLFLLGLGLFMKMVITGEAFNSLPQQYEDDDNDQERHAR